MSHSQQPYKCLTEDEFQTKLSILQEYMRESNLDGTLDYYCPTSPVLHRVDTNEVYIVDKNLSSDREHFSNVIEELLRQVTEDCHGQIPTIHYIYA